MNKLIAVDKSKRRADCIVRAKNAGGTRSIGIAYFVPDPAVWERLAATPIGSMIKVRSELAEKGSPCAMQMIDFELATEE